jgi:hypothetical protein
VNSGVLDLRGERNPEKGEGELPGQCRSDIANGFSEKADGGLRRGGHQAGNAEHDTRRGAGAGRRDKSTRQREGDGKEADQENGDSGDGDSDGDTALSDNANTPIKALVEIDATRNTVRPPNRSKTRPPSGRETAPSRRRAARTSPAMLTVRR